MTSERYKALINATGGFTKDVNRGDHPQQLIKEDEFKEEEFAREMLTLTLRDKDVSIEEFPSYQLEVLGRMIQDELKRRGE